MKQNLTVAQAEELLKITLASFPHEECYTCECYLGFLTQLEIDSAGPFLQTLTRQRPDRSLIHSCMGCDPCPPGDAYADYLRTNKS